jgi:replicative DNA helicase
VRFATGFRPLDGYLGEGFAAGDLVLVAGRQGTGKTSFVLQIARHAIACGHPAVLASFEHDEATLLERFVAMEAAALGSAAVLPARRVAERFHGQPADVGDDAAWQQALTAVSDVGRLLHITTQGDVGAVSVSDLAGVVDAVKVEHGRAPIVVVDYLQKLDEGGLTDDERSGRIAISLKNLAMTARVPVVAIAAAGREGLVDGRRLRINHLRGAADLAYEADVVLLLNDKYDVVSRQHLVYDAPNAERMRGVTVVSIEKNRGGLDNVHIEFDKQFASNRFEPTGKVVTEQLVDARLVD